MGVTALLGVTEGETVDVSVGLPVLDLVPVGLPEGDADWDGVKEGVRDCEGVPGLVPKRVGVCVPLGELPPEAAPVGETVGVNVGEEDLVPEGVSVLVGVREGDTVGEGVNVLLVEGDGVKVGLEDTAGVLETEAPEEGVCEVVGGGEGVLLPVMLAVEVVVREGEGVKEGDFEGETELVGDTVAEAVGVGLENLYMVCPSSTTRISLLLERAGEPVTARGMAMLHCR